MCTNTYKVAPCSFTSVIYMDVLDTFGISLQFHMHSFRIPDIGIDHELEMGRGSWYIALNFSYTVKICENGSFETSDIS